MMFLKITRLRLSVLAVEICSTMHLCMQVEIQVILVTLHTGMVLVPLVHLVVIDVIDVKIGNMCLNKQNHSGQVYVVGFVPSFKTRMTPQSFWILSLLLWLMRL